MGPHPSPARRGAVLHAKAAFVIPTSGHSNAERTGPLIERLEPHHRELDQRLDRDVLPPDRKRVAFAGIHKVYAESDRRLAKQEKVFEWAKSKSGEAAL